MIELPPSLKLPRWDASPEVMTRWVHAILDAIGEEGVLRTQELLWSKTPDGDTVFDIYLDNWELEIDEAEHGNIEPLKKRLVSLGRTGRERLALDKIVDRFVRVETLPDGHRWEDRPMEEDDPVIMAVECARQITELWKKFYPEHERRRGLVPAVDIAAAYCGADLDKVASKLSHTPVEPPEGSHFHYARMQFRAALSRLPPLASAK